jgi:hypothetical protein
MKTSHIHTYFVIGLLCGISCFLTSCEKELLSEGTGRKVAVNFSVTGTDYIDETRSSVAQASELETTIIPLGDGFYLRATLTEEPVDKLRATVPLVEGQKVRLAAFQNTTSTLEGATADYFYTGGKLTPADPSAPLLVDENATYNFVAYSYFNDVTNYPVLANISSDNQLLWGTSGQTAITTSGSTVSISMVQKFAQAKVAVSTSRTTGTPNITAVSGVTIASGGNRCNLSLWNGTLSTGTPATQAVTFPTLTPASTVTSNYRTIYPVTSGATTTVTIGSIGISGLGDVKNIAGTFNQALLEGHSYILTLDLKGVVFAGSNIYWDGTQLTFWPAGHVGQENFYQGLYFKWGSMIGTSPKNVIFQSTDMLYYPTSAVGWTSTSLSASGYTSFGNIPYMSVAAAAARGGTGYANSYVTNGYALDNGGQPFNYTNKLGDICQRINPNYRYPTAEELFSGNTTDAAYNSWAAASAAVGWARGTDASGGAITFPTTDYTGLLNEDGTSVLDYDTYAHFGGGFATYKGVAEFPMAGGRAGNAGPNFIRFSVGSSYGRVISSSVGRNSMQDNYYITSLDWDETRVMLITDNVGTGAHGFPIRCVRNY